MEAILFLCVVAIIILIICVSKVNDKNIEMNIRLMNLEKQQQDIFGKAYYNYQQIKGINHHLDLTEQENQRIAETIRTPTVQGNQTESGSSYRNINVEEASAYNYNKEQIPPAAANRPVRATAAQTAANRAARTTAPVTAPQTEVNRPVSATAPQTAVNKPEPATAPQTAVSRPEPATAAQTAVSRPASATAAQTAVSRPASATAAQTAVSRPVPEAAVQKAVSRPASATAAQTAVSRPARVTAPQTAVNRPAPMFEARQKPAKKSESMTIEHWLGTHLFNIIASVMIFIGLILFCMLGYEYITDGMKIAAMHIVSLGFVGIGGYLTKKNRSVFSLGLTGCGMGSFFISILITHVYFHAINDIAAFSLLFVWIIFALFLSKKLNSIMLSITAHIGMAISVCFAFALGFSADRIMLPIIYQLASIAVIIIGNVICYKKTYRFGLFLSMGLLVYSSGVITYVLSKPGIVPNEVSAALTTAVFAVQFIALSFVSYLISVSCNHLEHKGKFGDLPYIIHIVNKALWSAGIIETAGSLVYIICRSVYGISGLVYPSVAVFLAAVGHLLVTVFMSEKLGFSEKLSKVSMYFISSFVTISLFIQATQRTVLHGMPLLFIYTGIVMLIRRYTRNKKLNHLISALIAAEMLYVCFYGYRNLSNVFVSLLYMVILGAFVLLHWFGQTGESRQKRFSMFKLAEFLWVCASIIPINISEFSDISLPLIISEFSLVGIIAYLTGYANEKDDLILQVVVKAEAIITLFAICVVMAVAGSGSLGDILIIRIVFLLMTASLFVVCCYDFATSNFTVFQVISAALLSAYITFFCVGYGERFAVSYIFKHVLSCMPFFFITALVLFVIYMLNKNTKLNTALTVFLGIDMLFMVTTGYKALASASKMTDSLVRLDIGFLSVLHFIIISVIVYLLWHTQPKSEENVPFVTLLKGALYFWSMIAVTVITSVLGSGIKAGSGYPWSFSIIFVIIINLAAIRFKYGKDRTLGKDLVTDSILEKIIYINSGVVLYTAMIFIGSRIKVYTTGINYAPLELSIRAAQIVTALGLLYMLAKYLLQIQNVICHLAVCFTATVFINAVCKGLPIFADIMYIYSIISMTVALVCIVAGFISKSKGMRMYGLILIMLCVLKLVLIDITSENSVSRVLAFIVGGIICFVISGIYNVFEKKFNEKTLITENTD